MPYADPRYAQPWAADPRAPYDGGWAPQAGAEGTQPWAPAPAGWPPGTAPPDRFGQFEPPPDHFGRGYDDAERTAQIYPSANPEYPGWSPFPEQAATGPGVPGVPGGTGGPWPAPRRGRRSRRIRLIALCAVVVVLASAVAVLVTRHPGTPGPVGTGSGSSLPPSIDNVRTDPAPVTESEIFPDSTVTTGGSTFSTVAQSVPDNCSLAARGPFAAALTTATCERVLRVTFVSSSKHYVVTAGVAALPTLAAAQQANKAVNFHADSWFTGLDGPARSGAGHVTTTPGYGYQVILGRYIIFALATPGSGNTAHPDSSTLTALSHDFTSVASRAIIARENART